MMNFCTYFDSYYLLKGLGLYLSLKKVASDFHLYVMALDKECYDRLKSLELSDMTVELLSTIETPELLAVKPTRSRGEYCWTCGPSAIHYFLTEYNLDSITYLDSDLIFFSDPAVVFEEIGNASVAITEQGIGKREESTYGKYCVQYMTFRNNSDGLGALTWWRDSCIGWCFQRIEDNRYADQKYLDEFPKRWNDVYVIRNLGVGIAPWNMHRYSYGENTFSYKGVDYPYVFFHMHGVKTEIKDSILHLSSLHFGLSDTVIEKFFLPYALVLKEVLVKYLGYEVKDVAVHDMPILKKINYSIREHLRGNKFVRWIWFSLMNKKDNGHGTKF